MKSPRNILLAVGVLGAAVLVLYFLAGSLFLGPMADHSEHAERVQRELRQLDVRLAMGRISHNKLRSIDEQTLGENELEVRQRMNQRLVELWQRSGLEGKMSLNLQRGSSSPKAFREMTAGIKVSGPLEHVVNFLYLLKTDPHLHHVQINSLSRDERTGDVDLDLRYSTIVLYRGKQAGAARDETLATTRPVLDQSAASLNSTRRRLYTAITSRNPLKPWVKAPPRPKPTPVAQNPNPTPKPTPTSKPTPRKSPYVLVSLSGPRDEPVVSVMNQHTREIEDLQVGDSVKGLSGAEIVMVDYRPLPYPQQPELYSSSRMIVKIGQEYWAVELGDNFSDKRLMKHDNLPERLKSGEARDDEPAAGGAEDQSARTDSPAQ
ncbi:MAG: hypothetical protein ACLFVU_02480 [Phycisphaerae bacterium]